MSLFGAPPPNRTETMAITHSGASGTEGRHGSLRSGDGGFTGGISRLIQSVTSVSLAAAASIAKSAVMSCIATFRPSRIESNPVRRRRFRAAVRNAATRISSGKNMGFRRGLHTTPDSISTTRHSEWCSHVRSTALLPANTFGVHF